MRKGAVVYILSLCKEFQITFVAEKQYSNVLNNSGDIMGLKLVRTSR